VLECLSLTSAGAAEHEPFWKKRRQSQEQQSGENSQQKQTADGRMQ